MTDKELEKIYNEAYKAVYWTAMVLLKNAADAEDIVQDTFVTLIESYDSIKDKAKVMPWLKKIAANKCLDRIKLSKTDAVEDEFFEDVEAVPEDFLPDTIVESAEMRKIIMDIIERSLSDDIRRTLILFYFDEMSTKEIAETLGVPEGTVRRRLNFARNKIKKEVEKYEEENKTKLFGMAALPFLSKLFIKEAEQVPFKAMPASLTTLSASAQASAQGAGTKIAASAAKKGTGIIMKNVIIGGIVAVVAIGAIVGTTIGLLSKKADTEPKNTAVNEVVDNRQDKADKDDTTDGNDIVSNDSGSETANGSGITGFSAVGKMTTPYGDYYLKETFGEFLEQFASSDKFEIKISDKEGNKYTMDDLDTVIDSKFVSATVKCDLDLVCNITTQRVSGEKLGDIRIEMFKTNELTTSLEMNGFIIYLGKTTIDDIVSGIGDFSKRTNTDENLNAYPYIFEGCELGQCDVNCNDDGTVKYVAVNAIDTFHRI
jgi:RNA polymerase sigma factor (sigma-70 family)